MGDQSSAKKRKPVEIRVMQMDAVRNFTYLEGLGSHRWCAVHGVFHKLKGNFNPELLATAPERRYCKAFADEAACVAHFERNGGTWSTDISLAQLRFFMEDSKYTRTNVPGLNIEMDVLEEQHPEGSYRYVRQDGQKDAIIRVSGIVSDRGQVMYDHVIIDGQTKALAVSHYKFFELIVDHDLVISELRSGVESKAIEVKQGDQPKDIPMPFVYYVLGRAFAQKEDGTIDWPNGVTATSSATTKIRALINSIYKDKMGAQITEEDMVLWLSKWDKVLALQFGYIEAVVPPKRLAEAGSSSSSTNM